MTATPEVSTDLADLTQHVTGVLSNGALYPQRADILAPLVVERLNPAVVRKYRVTNNVRVETFYDLDTAKHWAKVLDGMYPEEHVVESWLEVLFTTPPAPYAE